MRQLVCACLMAGAVWSDRSEPADDNSLADKAAGRRWAVILVGIPGDDEHAELFRKTADAWQKWLTESQQIPAGQVLRLPVEPARKLAEQEPAATPVTAEMIRMTFSDLTGKLGPDDSLWLFTLGHGNYDGRRAWFHVAGRDPSHEEFGRWLSELRCREQIFWLTQASSGWFVKPLARPGRIVIAASAADDESNETEFPLALAEVVARPLKTLDVDQDGRLSVAELFNAVVQEVASRFKNGNRLQTEHAQLDDDGDGLGSENILSRANSIEDDAAPGGKALVGARDGVLARRTFVPVK